MIKNIQKISAKIRWLEEKISTTSGRKKHRAWLELQGKRATLRHLCKLYIWGVK